MSFGFMNGIFRRRIFLDGMKMKHPDKFDSRGKFIRPQRSTSGTTGVTKRRGNVFERLSGRYREDGQGNQGRSTLG